MKYINKEYGFAFRPPFFDKFYQQSEKGPKISKENYPRSFIQGVGYDYCAINGAMLIGKNGSLWGVRVLCYNGKKWLDNDDFVLNMGSSCANTADGSFAHFSSGLLSVKWIKYDEQSMIIQVGARKKMRIRIIFYPCYGFFGELSIEGSYVRGRSPFIAVIPGQISLSHTNAIFKERYLAIDEQAKEREYFMAQSYNPPSDSANGAFNEAIMEFVINKNQPAVHVFASVGNEEIFNQQIPALEEIVKRIDVAELSYGVNKTMGTGVLSAPVERMFNSVLWSRIYYPYLMTEIFSPKRTLLNNHFDIWGLEENCSAILGSYIISEKAEQQLKYTLDDKIMNILAVWHIFSHTNEKSGMLALYRKLTKMYPPEAALVTADKNKNEIAYKWTDSPLKEKSNYETMYSLDMSSLRLLAFDILERIAVIFDTPEKEQYKNAKNAQKTLINKTFWNEEKGLYINRYVSGKWADSYGATSFYPFIAGAPDCIDKISMMISNLLDIKQFWGEYAVPTLSINNREYGLTGKPDNNGKRFPPYLEYRGSIVPYVNYIIYHGLVRYGLDEIAGQLAQKSARLWAANESDNVENFSIYLPKGKRVKKRDYLSSNGNMLALIGVQELIDLEYFRADLKTNSLKFGTFVLGEHSLTNLKLLGKSYSIEVNDMSTMLICENINLFKGEGGRMVVRNFLANDGACEFIIDARSNISINLDIPAQNKKNIKYYFIVPIGKSMVKAENGMINIERL